MGQAINTGNGGRPGRTFVYRAPDEAATVGFASRLAALAVPGTVLALDGDLGAGKTRFAQAFASGLGVPGIVNSPTFTIIKEYEGGRLPFYHMDVYRLSEAEADELGLEEYFEGDGVSLVEWASLIEPLLPEERLHVRLTATGPTARLLECRPLGERYAAWCAELGMDETDEEGKGE